MTTEDTLQATAEATETSGMSTGVEAGGVADMTKVDRIRDYVKEHPEATRVEAGKALAGFGIDARKVSSTVSVDRKKVLKRKKDESDATSADIAAAFGFDPGYVSVLLETGTRRRRSGRKKRASKGRPTGGSQPTRPAVSAEMQTARVEALIAWINSCDTPEEAQFYWDLVQMARTVK